MNMTRSSYPLGGWLLPGGMVVGSFKFNLMLLRNSDELLWRLSSRL